MLEERPVGVEAAEIDAMHTLLEAAFGPLGYLDSRFLAWCYADNPAGGVVGTNAWAGDRIAAHYATVPLRARLFGREVRGVLSLHTGTHPDFQKRGLFRRLAETTYEEALRQGYDFVVGVANAASTPGFVEHLGFQLVAPLDVRVGVGTPPGSNPTDEWELERLWNPAEVAWRLAAPNRTYRRSVSEGAVVVYAPTGRAGIWVEVGRRPVEEGGVGSALSRLRPLGVRNPLRLWMGLDASRRWRGEPWLPLPDRLRPSPLNLIYRDLREPGRTLDPRRVVFSVLDFDAY